MADILKAIVGVEVKGEAGLAKLSNSVGKTEAALKKLAPATVQANTSMINLSRVVQDAPFGFIGIANNIDPLLQSFQSLKASTGSTGGALKALGASFLGPGGLALGVSAVTSALALFGDKLFGSSKAASALAEENKKLSESIASELVQLTALVGIVQNTNSSRTDQANALRTINEQYSKYLPNLGTEKITAENLATAYDKITDSLLRQAVVKGLMKQIEIEVAKTAEKILNLEQQRIQAQKSAQKETENNFKRIGVEQKLAQAVDLKNKAVADGFQGQLRANQLAQGAIGTSNVYGGIIEKLKNDLKESLKPALDLVNSFQDLGIELKDIKGAKVKKLDFEAQFATVNLLGKPIRVEGAIFDFNNAQFGTDLLKAAQYKFSDRLKSMEKLVIGPKLYIDPKVFESLRLAVDQLKTKLESMQRLAETVAGTISSAFADAFSEIANGKSVMDSIGSAIKQVVIQLARAAVQAFIFRAIMNVISPVSAGASKLSAIASGFNFGGFRAKGGPVSAGRSYIVGERGPELFTPGVSGGITPNGRLGSMDGMFSGGGEYTFRLRGQDLVAAMATTGRAQIRLV